MAEMEKINEQELENVSGGVAGERWVTVYGLQTGYLALRTVPTYDANNEIRGSESYNGQQLLASGTYVRGGDGRSYAWVYNPRSGMSGWTNASFLY